MKRTLTGVVLLYVLGLTMYIPVSSLAGVPYQPLTHPSIPNPGSISGIVRDYNNEPIKGALVTATFLATGEIRSAVTTEQGRYEIPDVKDGDQKITVSAKGFNTRTFIVKVQSATPTTVLDVNFSLSDVILPGESNRCRVEGTVKDRKTNTGIEGAKVTIRELDTSGKPTHETKTDKEGKYVISNVAPGRIKLEASATDYVSPEVRRFRLQEREIRSLDITMKPKK